MKKHFSHYFQLTDIELSGMLDASLIALDANVLLDLYRYSRPTRGALVQILRKLKSRLWLPHQAGQEFHVNRLHVLKERADKVGEAGKSLVALREALNAIHRTPGDTGGTQPPPNLARAYASVEAHLSRRRAEAIPPTLQMKADPVWAEVTRLFDGRVGEPYDAGQLTELYKEGAKRYQGRRPPGFEDEKKPEPERYGDYVLWRQLLDKANSAGRPVVLITSERKGDWWLIQDGKRMGPRPELREEMLGESGQLWHLYEPGLFMDVMGRRLNVPASEPALEEVRALTDREPQPMQAGAYAPMYRSLLNDLSAASNARRGANALSAYAAGLDSGLISGLSRGLGSFSATDYLGTFNTDLLASLAIDRDLVAELQSGMLSNLAIDPNLLASLTGPLGRPRPKDVEPVDVSEAASGEPAPDGETSEEDDPELEEDPS